MTVTMEMVLAGIGDAATRGLLLRGGIQLAASHRMIDPRNVRWSQRHIGPVPAWDDKRELQP